MELYAYSLLTQSWRGHDQLYIYLHFSSESYVKWATVVVQRHKISNTTEIMHNECWSTADMDWLLTLVCKANKGPKEVKLCFFSPWSVDRFKDTVV